ncbi:HAMP domain-containing protein, partial [Streptomyces sp. NPDC052015]
MRWALVKVCVAVTTMVVVAFAVPLGLVIKEMARDRAFSNAEREAAAVAPALSITTDRDQLERVVASAASDEGMAVHLPASDGKAASDIGRQRAADKDITTTRKLGRASTAEVAGGSTLLQPTALSSGEIAVVEVYVPESEVSNGVGTAWAVLAAVGVALIIGSVAVADRLGVRMVQPAQRLVEGAHELGEGKLGARVPEEGPTELRLAAVAFNSMADQVVQLMAN